MAPVPTNATIELAGRTVRRIGLGTNRLTDTPENRALLEGGVEAGLGHIDTAHLYTGGESERTIGAALASFADNLVAATKGGYRPGEGSPERLRSQVEASVERLRTETIALYYLHRVDPETPLERSLDVLKEYVDAGRIEHVGLSEVSVEQIERGRAVLPVSAVQNEYGLSERKWEPVVDYCEREGIPFVPFYPLGGGRPPALGEVAAARDASPVQVALAWLLKRSPTMLPIPGTLSPAHLRANLAAVEIELSDEEFAALDRGDQ